MSVVKVAVLVLLFAVFEVMVLPEERETQKPFKWFQFATFPLSLLSLEVLLRRNQS